MCCSVLQCIAISVPVVTSWVPQLCRTMLHCIGSVLQCLGSESQHVPACRSVLQCVAAWCDVLQCLAVYRSLCSCGNEISAWSVLHCIGSELQGVGNVSQRVAACRSVLQCVAVLLSLPGVCRHAKRDLQRRPVKETYIWNPIKKTNENNPQKKPIK